MVYMLLAILCGSMSVIIFKIFARMGIGVIQSVAINYLTAFLLGLLLNVSGGEVVNPLIQPWLMWGVVMGFLFISAFVLMSRSTMAVGVAITSISARMSLIIPVILSSVLFGISESPSWLAIMIIFAAMVMILWNGRFGDSQKDAKARKNGWLLPLSVLLSFGICHFLLKYVQNGIEERIVDAEQVQSQFAALTSTIFLSAMVIGFLMCFLSKDRSSRRFSGREIIGGVILGAANFFSTYLVLYALVSVPAVVFSPVYNVGVVLFSSIAGVACFGEVLGLRRIVGMIIALLGIVMFFVI